jgi:hypothetical protein
MTKRNRAATFGALCAVDDERDRQFAKWGNQRQSWVVWITALTEEVGEAAKEAITLYTDPDITWDHPATLAKFRAELVQIAAVSVAIIEHIDEVLGE